MIKIMAAWANLGAGLGASLTILAFCAPAPSIAQPASPPLPSPPRHLIMAPQFTAMPTADDLDRVYPRGALQKRLEGHVRMQCAVNREGELERCSVLSETPSGQGFGGAALALSRYFRVKPVLVGGAPIDWGMLVLPFAFKPPEG